MNYMRLLAFEVAPPTVSDQHLVRALTPTTRVPLAPATQFVD